MSTCTNLAPLVPFLEYGARRCVEQDAFLRWLLKKAYRWARRYMNSDDAEDFASTFVLLVRNNPERFLKPHLASVTPYQWLHCCADREVRLVLYRDRKRRCKELPLSEWEETCGGVVSEHTSPEQIALRRDLLVRIVQATRLLTLEQQEVLHRFAMQEQTATEIAAALHTTAHAVRSRIYRIREQMRHTVLEEGLNEQASSDIQAAPGRG